MSQQANMELVENLRPFIHKMIADYLESVCGGCGGGPGGCTCDAGDNINIVDGVVSLDPDVIIEGSLRTPSLILEDEDGVPREVLLRIVNGRIRMYVECDE